MNVIMIALAGVLAMGSKELASLVASRVGLEDRPDGVLKNHSGAVPPIGGWMIVPCLVLAGYWSADQALAQVTTGCLILFVVGVVDDWVGVGRGLRLAAQAAFGAIAVLVAIPESRDVGLSLIHI